MEPGDQERADARFAAEWNQKLAQRVSRSKGTRLAAAVLLMAAAIGCLVVPWNPARVWAVPCLLASLIAMLLYSDARVHLREIRKRKWVRVTPRIRRGPRTSAEDPARSTPSA